MVHHWQRGLHPRPQSLQTCRCRFISKHSDGERRSVDEGAPTCSQQGAPIHQYHRFPHHVTHGNANITVAVGNGNTVGVIPYFLNGGISVYSPLIGYGCENVLSAKLVTANGDVIEVTERYHPELLWAIRGAGQFFGGVSFRTNSSYMMRGHCYISSYNAAQCLSLL